MENVAYLEADDVSSSGLASYIGKNKPVVLMVMGEFCHFCQDAKPVFQKFGQAAAGNVVAAAIVIDGDPSEKQAYEAVKMWLTSPGVPQFLGFDKNGKFEKIHTGKRDLESLILFAKSL